MLCYRCGSHNSDGSGQCQSCGQPFTGAHKALAGQVQKKSPRALSDKIRTAPFSLGDVVNERFVVEALIGSGPSGHVYRVKDRDFRAQMSDELVALKIVHPRLLQTDDDRQLFERSLLRTKKMAHPRIARVFQIDVSPKRAFYTMQLALGLPLQQIIELRKGQKGFSLAECEPLLQQIVSALEHAHRFTAHGLLKPQNIIVQPGELKITDFATTRGLPRKPYFAALGEALAYAAPELRRDGTDVLPSADVFSLGVVLTEMLTGTRPDTSQPGLVEVPSAPHVTEPIRAFLQKAMDPMPDKRWRSPSELMQGLQALVEEPMSEPVVISAAPATVAAEEATGEVAAAPEAQVPLGDQETLLLPLEAPPVDETTTPIQRAEKNKARRKARGVAPVPRNTKPAPDPVRSMLVARQDEARTRRAATLAASVFLFSVAVVGLALWARGQYRGAARPEAEASASSAAMPARPVAEIPTPLVEKPRGSEPVKVAELKTTRVQSDVPVDSRKSPRIRPPSAKLAVIETPAPAPVEAAAEKTECKKGMVFVPAGRFSMGSSPSDEFHSFSDKLLQSVSVAGFCVDRYEYPNALGAQPIVNVSLKQAKATCEAQGKRLCGEEEWERACKGPKNARFPYGNDFEDAACNVGSDEGPRALKPIGASTACRSGFGVVDLAGNVAEMTAATMSNGDVVIKGGDAQHPDYASRCANRSALAPLKRAGNVGFRCCADPD